MDDIALPYRTMAYNNAWANHRLLSACARLSEAEFVAERTGFFPSLRATLNHILLLLHLFQHQVHHRGQAHAMLSGTSVRPPQLDEFFSAGEAGQRADEFAALGWTEAEVWDSVECRLAQE